MTGIKPVIAARCGICACRRRVSPHESAGAHWAGIMIGAAVIVISFAMDYRNIMAGGIPHPFNWSVFSAGLLIGMGSYAWAARAAQRTDQNVIAPMQSAEAAQ